MIVTIKGLVQRLLYIPHLGCFLCADTVIVYVSVKEVYALVRCPVLRSVAVRAQGFPASHLGPGEAMFNGQIL